MCPHSTRSCIMKYMALHVVIESIIKANDNELNVEMRRTNACILALSMPDTMSMELPRLRAYFVVDH
jgi:hypothetical protein